MQIFDVIIFFELRTIQQKTVKPTYLCPLGARKLAEGKGHETVSQMYGRLVPNNSWSPTGMSTLFDIFLERIMTDALEDHEALSALDAKQLPVSALLLTSMAQQERKKNWQN